MTKTGKSRRLSAGELEMLQMLWRDGPVTLSEAQRGLRRTIGYTTVQTRLNRLVEKGVVARTSQRPAHYRAAVATEDVSAGHLNLLLERVSGGSIVPLVAHLMKDRRLSSEEILALRTLISESEHQGGTQKSQGGTR
jgi:BlaI family transcriptional regulator, penicillinase repressor